MNSHKTTPFIALLFPLLLCAQKRVMVESKTEKLGTNLLSQHELTGKHYTFNSDIYNVYPIDSANLFILFRKLNKKQTKYLQAGTLGGFNIHRDSFRWQQPVDFNSENFVFLSGMLFDESTWATSRIDAETGNPMWSSKMRLEYVNKETNIGIGPKELNIEQPNRDIVGIDLLTGEKLWKEYILTNWGWSEILQANDSTITIVGSGLHSINIRNGKGWEYEAITGGYDVGILAAKIAASVAIGVATGVYLVPVQDEKITNIVSNTIESNGYYYLASKKEVACVSTTDGSVKWSIPTPNGMASKSSIFRDENLLYHVNFGIAASSRGICLVGKPFLAAYSIETGTLMYRILLDDKYDAIDNFVIKDDDIWLLSNKGIDKFELETGALKESHSFTNQQMERFSHFADYSIYLDSTDVVVPISEQNIEGQFLQNFSNDLIRINNNCEPMQKYKSGDYYSVVLNSGGYKILKKGKEWVIINSSNRKIATLDFCTKPFAIENSIFWKKDNNLYQIDINQLIKE